MLKVYYAETNAYNAIIVTDGEAVQCFIGEWPLSDGSFVDVNEGTMAMIVADLEKTAREVSFDDFQGDTEVPFEEFAAMTFDRIETIYFDGDEEKARFRALRETVGMTQAYLAQILGVRPLSIKRWENPNVSRWAPEDAWNVLNEVKEKQDWAVQAALEIVRENKERMGHAPNEVNLSYWFSAEQYEKAHPGRGIEWQMANATTRRTAAILEHLGYTVVYGFEMPDGLDDHPISK